MNYFPTALLLALAVIAPSATAQKSPCDCGREISNGGTTSAEYELATNKTAELRRTVASCISRIREELLRAERAAERAERKPCVASTAAADAGLEACKDTLDGLEKAAVADAIRLVDERNRAVEALKKGVDAKAVETLQVASAGLTALGPVVNSDGDSVALVKTTTRDAIDKISAKQDLDAACGDIEQMRLEGDDVTKLVGCLAAARSKDCATRLVERKQKCDAPAPAADTARAERDAQQQCMVYAATLEQTLRDIANVSTKKLENLKSKHDDLGTTEKAANDAEQDKQTAKLEDIRKVIPIPGEADYESFEDFGQWFGRFQAGFEYVTLNEAFGKGFPRISTLVGLHLPGPRVPTSSPAAFRLSQYGTWVTFSAMLTSTAEGTAEDTSNLITAAKTNAQADAKAAPTAPADPKKAIEFELQFFHPFWRSGYPAANRTFLSYIGPLLTGGAVKRDQDTFAAKRFYGGIRAAQSPGQFADLLIGHTGHLRSERLELRGQMPFPITSKSNLSIGADGNFGINKRRSGCVVTTDQPCAGQRLAEPDIIRIFLTYDLSNTDLFGRWKK